MSGENATCSPDNRAITATATSTADKSTGDKAISIKATGKSPMLNPPHGEPPWARGECPGEPGYGNAVTRNGNGDD